MGLAPSAHEADGVWLDKARRFVEYWRRQRSPFRATGRDSGLELPGLWPLSRLLYCFGGATLAGHETDPVTGLHNHPPHLQAPRARGVSSVALRASSNTPLHDQFKIGPNILCRQIHALIGSRSQVLPATKASRKPPLDAVPKTLAQVPGSDGPGDVDGNEFSDVDRLTGDAMEAAIAKMSAAQRDRYMAGV